MTDFGVKSDVSWIVCQVGAREHYSIPRALVGNGEQLFLYTDYWAGEASILPIPEKLRQRFHPDISDEQVVSWNWNYLALEAKFRLLNRKGWAAAWERNKWFTDKVCRHLERVIEKANTPPVVFAYSYAARDIFSVARTFGCPTVLGQIDPGPVEMRLVERLHREAGVVFNDQPSKEYWISWRDECALAGIIMVNSPWSFSALEKEGVSPDKLVEVPLAYERLGEVTKISEIPEMFTTERPLRVLFLGQVTLRKGVLELAGAIESLEGLPVEWTVVGEGEEWLDEKLRKLPQTSVVGGVPRGEVAYYYRKADVFILPTHSDGYALTQLEAASFGLPVIASRFCAEIVHNGTNGILLEKVSAEEIRTAILGLLEKPADLALYRKNMQRQKYCTMKDLSDNLSGLRDKIDSSRAGNND